jgi:hypothetical protein
LSRRHNRQHSTRHVLLAASTPQTIWGQAR